MLESVPVNCPSFGFFCKNTFGFLNFLFISTSTDFLTFLCLCLLSLPCSIPFHLSKFGQAGDKAFIIKNKHGYDLCLLFITSVWSMSVNIELAEIQSEAAQKFLHCQKSPLQSICQNKS